MEIKGYTAEEIASSEKERLMSDYAFIKSKYAEIRDHERQIENIRKTIIKLETEYRRDSVNRVLHWIRSKKITDEKELDTLLCHCQNKLSGNIDGVEITLDTKEGDE